MRNLWKKEEDDFLKNNRNKLSYEEISLKINRSIYSIKKRITFLKIKFDFKKPTKDLLYENYIIKNLSKNEICYLLNISLTYLNQILKEYKLYRKNKKVYNNVGKKNKFWKGIEDIPKTYITLVKKNAIRRNIEYNLSNEDLWNLYVKQNKKCKISNLEINFYIRTRDRKSGTASLDRIDSSKGYTIDNVQWVHKDINFMKQQYSQEYFINICKIIAENNKENK